jgi:DNA-binding CsgD family transcriptional regulator
MALAEDWIRILEAAYELGGDENEWLASVASAARPGLDCGLGVVAYFFDASAPQLRVFGYCGAGADAATIDIARRTHELPAWRSDQSSELLRATYRAGSALVDSTSTLGKRREREFIRGFGASKGEWPLRRIVILNVADPSHRGCVLGAPDPGASTNLLRRKAPWSRVASHLAAGLRLRRRLAEAESVADDAEAILSPSGTLVHAQGRAKERTAREILRDATLAVEKARGRLRRSDPDAALGLWRGLLDGRWSLVDRFDTDGRRFVVAHRNEATTRGLRALTLRERQVASYVALAHPNKLIAYELGLSLGSVSAHLRTILAKLGVRSRVELVQLASGLGVRGVVGPKREH